jgi:hypothetical protein
LRSGSTVLVGHGRQKNDACALKVQSVHVKIAAISGNLEVAVFVSGSTRSPDIPRGADDASERTRENGVKEAGRRRH